MITIKILTGSTRPGRFNIQPAEWIFEQAKKRDDIKVEFVDLAEVNLPFLDEALPAAMGQYANPHTKAWAKVIGEADGFIFVTPEYNYSFSAVLKNAIDYLNKEWNYKPVTFVSYGAQAGGARAIEHLRGVVAQIRMFSLRDQVMFPNYWENMDQNGKFKFTERDEKNAVTLLDELVFWATEMKASRKKMKI